MGLLKDIWDNRGLISEALKLKYFTSKDAKEVTKDVINGRKEICNQCPYMSENAKIIFSYNSMRFDKHCTKCGCNIDLKTSSLHSSCPDNPPRWGAIVTEEESNQIQQLLEDEEKEVNSSKEHKGEGFNKDPE